MKKILFTVVALFACVFAFAGSPVKVVSGALPSLEGKKIAIVHDYSKMMILDEDSKKTMTIDAFCEMKGEDWVRDKGKDNVDAEGDFAEVIADKASKITFVTDKSNADYVLIVQPTTFGYGNPFAFKAFLPKDVNGFFEGNFILKTADGSAVAEMNCEKTIGPGGYNWTHQKCNVYKTIAKQLASVLKKAK